MAALCSHTPQKLLHPDNDLAHLLMVRAVSMSAAGTAAANAARQPFLASVASRQGKGGGKQQSGRVNQGHVSYSVIRGGVDVGPYFYKHPGKVHKQQDAAAAPKQQDSAAPKQQQQQSAAPAPKQQQQALPQSQPSKKPSPTPPGCMRCPFPGCTTAPDLGSGNQQPTHELHLPTSSNLEYAARSFDQADDLEAHVFTAHRWERLNGV